MNYKLQEKPSGKKSFEDGMILWKSRIEENSNSNNKERERESSSSSSNQNLLRLPTLTSSASVGHSMSGGGCGAPRRTPSGHLIPELRGHPDIRYHQQNTLALQNSFRYNFDREAIRNYKNDLDKQLEELKSSRKKSEDQGDELVSTMRKFKSLPKLNNLSSTDVTNQFFLSPRTQEGESYRESLRNQYLEKMQSKQKQRLEDIERNREHFSTWDRYWGKPGGGAPLKAKIKKEKLFLLLHNAFTK